MQNPLPDIDKACELLANSSRYFAVLLRRFPEHREWLSRKLLHRFTAVELYKSLSGKVSTAAGENLWLHMARILRNFKQQHFLRLGARNLLGLDSFEETVSQLSDLAITMLQTSLRVLLDHPDLWLPPGDLNLWLKERPSINLVVIGLGKLGGRELNFVSDIDLLFLHHATSPESSNVAQALLPRLAQNISRLFSDNIEGDRVFIVDFRLRPGGKDGELVPSLGYAVHYYLLQGRSWERLALIKAAPVAGDISLGNQFLSEVQPFVFRRFLDFQAIDEMKSIRDQMLRESPQELPGPGYNVKLGRGGIREIEFLVQVFQLIYGGRLRRLREKNTLRCLELLREEGLLSQSDARALTEAYIFLRNMEHWIQLQENRQTQVIPRDSTAQNMLARALGFADPQKLFEQLAAHTDTVRHHFEKLFAQEEPESDVSLPSSEDEARQSSPLFSWLEETIGKDIATESWEFLEKDETFINQPDLVETPVKQWAQSIVKRPGLLKFLISPKARQHQALEKALFSVVHIPLMKDLLVQVPSIVESFTEGSESIKDYETWSNRAEEILADCGSFEDALLWLRRLKNERMVHIALWDVNHNPPIQDLEKELSLLADFFVKSTYRLTCSHVLQSIPEDYPLVVAAMGKWGSYEMGYRSDLDLVFIYDAEESEDPSKIPEQTTRLIQRFVRLLSMTLQDGPGYEVDMRLRPTGNYGPLIVTLSTWEEYYENKADIWEIASLLRFRPVAGPSGIAEKLREKARLFCFQHRTVEAVVSRLCELKSRMEEELARETEASINLKLGRGGLVEVEFLCQAAALIEERFPWRHPLATPDSLPYALEFWQVPDSERPELHRAFRGLRRLKHRLDLLGKTGDELTHKDFETLKQLGLWGKDQQTEKYQDWNDIKRFRRLIRSRWEKVCSKNDGG